MLRPLATSPEKGGDGTPPPYRQRARVLSQQCARIRRTCRADSYGHRPRYRRCDSRPKNSGAITPTLYISVDGALKPTSRHRLPNGAERAAGIGNTAKLKKEAQRFVVEIKREIGGPQAFQFAGKIEACWRVGVIQPPFRSGPAGSFSSQSITTRELPVGDGQRSRNCIIVCRAG